MSFSFDDSSITSQGELSSTYTQSLSAYLQTAEGADFAAFLAYQQYDITIAEALALKQQIMEGDFSLAGLFGAAQSKTAAVDGNLVTDPEPVLTAGTFTVALQDMLGSLDTWTWTTVSKSGTVYHTREFYSAGDQPFGYDTNWSVAAPLVEHTGSASISFSLQDLYQLLQNNGSAEVFLPVPSWSDDPRNMVSGTVQLSVTGDIDKTADEWINVILEGGSSFTFGLFNVSGSNLEPNSNNGGYTELSNPAPMLFNSNDPALTISWTSGENVSTYIAPDLGGVDDIFGTINYTYSYWAPDAVL